ncbi:MAG: hypothetical protein N2Z80_05490 [Hydrogenothermaceae bacterium]|nr:hypothetical protein [Hydrogenothermaceae bacterium]
MDDFRIYNVFNVKPIIYQTSSEKEYLKKKKKKEGEKSQKAQPEKREEGHVDIYV